jgi:ribosomal protein S18 acetylase RimI-like enzyme
MNGIEIRDIRPDELHMLKNFLYEAIFQKEGEPRLPKEIINEPSIRVYIEEWGRPDDLCLVALADGEYAGAVWTRLLTGDTKGYGYIDDLTPELSISLFETFRGKGIGTALMGAMIRRLKACGYSRVSLSVTKQNPAYHLYSKLGFLVAAEPNDDYLMVLDLIRCDGIN